MTGRAHARFPAKELGHESLGDRGGRGLPFHRRRRSGHPVGGQPKRPGPPTSPSSWKKHQKPSPSRAPGRSSSLPTSAGRPPRHPVGQSLPGFRPGAGDVRPPAAAQGPFVHPTAVVAEDVTRGGTATSARTSWWARARASATGSASSPTPRVSRRDHWRRQPDPFPRRRPEHCVLGRRAILHSGAVIGGDRSGFAKGADGSYTNIPQAGRWCWRMTWRSRRTPAWTAHLTIT